MRNICRPPYQFVLWSAEKTKQQDKKIKKKKAKSTGSVKNKQECRSLIAQNSV